MNSKYNPELKQFSQRLRREMTKEECHLWYDFLKKLPVNINRQKVIGNYIVDFYCASAKLVIEVDGLQHTGKDAAAADKLRDNTLKELGITVVRYSNDAINHNFHEVCKDIRNRIEKKD